MSILSYDTTLTVVHSVIRLLASPSHSPGRLRAKPIEVQYEMVSVLSNKPFLN